MHLICRVMLLPAAIAALLLPSACAEAPKSAPKVGEEYEISQAYENSEQASDGASGSSRGRNTFLERVVGAREGGLELEFDLSRDATAQDRARTWQFPVRVFKPSTGPLQLLNRPELEARLEGWLKAAGWTRAVCGRWIFTWNAFLIDCDPQSVVRMLEALDMRPANLRDGAPYEIAGARRPGTLTRSPAGPDGGETFAVAMEVDPEAVRRARAESDVAVGEIMRQPVTLEAALRARADESVSGTISVTFVTDARGNVRRRTKVTKVETKAPNGRSESRTATETVERRPVLGL